MGNLIVIDQNEPMLLELDARDLEELLGLSGWRQLGHILELNRTARYQNRLNAFALMNRLAEVTGEMEHGSSKADW